MKLYANVGPDGLIVFETHPDPTLGRLPVASVPLKDAKKLKDIISVNARHGRTDFLLYVPGVPEAKNQREGMKHLMRFRKLIEMRLNGETGWP